jgi:uncharacterized protein (TIGR02271 family)
MQHHGDADAAHSFPVEAGAEVVAHAERLLISSQRVAVERVRFSKRIVTTTRTIEVPVRVEELVVHHEPFQEGVPVEDTGTISGGEDLVIVLHEEVPEVTLRVQPVERVSVRVRDVADEEIVSTELRRETISVDVVDRQTTSDRH